MYADTYKGWPVDFIEITTNQGEQVNYGGSIQLEYVLQKSVRNHISAYLSLSYADGKVNVGEIKDAEVPGVIPLMIKLGADLHKPRWTCSTRLVWTNKQRVFAFKPTSSTERQSIDGYLDVRSNLTYRFNTLISMFLRGENLLNQRYTHVNLGASPEVDLQGATSVEFTNGTPQYPLRLHIGLNIKL